MNKVKFWISNARSISLPQSILPSLLAISLAAFLPEFNLLLAIVALFGIISAHLGMNLADDYFDYKKMSVDFRREVNDEGHKAHSDKCHYIISGKATVKELAYAIVSFLAVAGLCGVIVMIFSGIEVGIVALLGLLLGISYSGWPFRLCYHGLGEFVIGTMFGPLLMIGMQYAASGTLTLSTILLSIAVGFLVINIVYTHSILDFKVDKKAHKVTFATLLGSKNKQLIFLAICNIIPFLIVVTGVILGIFHPLYLAILPLLFLGIHLVKSMKAFLNGTPYDTTPRKWMGPMGDFEKYKAIDMDWFLIRWLLARNIVTFFCLILIVVNIILLIIK